MKKGFLCFTAIWIGKSIESTEDRDALAVLVAVEIVAVLDSEADSGDAS